MSHRAVTAVSDHSEARGSARVVMLVLADHADDYGFCRPGIERLSHKCRIDQRSVQRHLAALKDSGELQIFPRRGRANCYRIVVDGLLVVDAEERAKLKEWGIVVGKGGDVSVGGDSPGPKASPELEGTGVYKDQKASSLSSGDSSVPQVSPLALCDDCGMAYHRDLLRGCPNCKQEAPS